MEEKQQIAKTKPVKVQNNWLNRIFSRNTDDLCYYDGMSRDIEVVNLAEGTANPQPLTCPSRKGAMRSILLQGYHGYVNTAWSPTHQISFILSCAPNMVFIITSRLTKGSTLCHEHHNFDSRCRILRGRRNNAAQFGVGIQRMPLASPIQSKPRLFYWIWYSRHRTWSNASTFISVLCYCDFWYCSKMHITCWFIGTYIGTCCKEVWICSN